MLLYTSDAAEASLHVDPGGRIRRNKQKIKHKSRDKETRKRTRRRNRRKKGEERRKEVKTVRNGVLEIPSTSATGVMVYKGGDSLTIDMEHGLVDYSNAVPM